MEPTKELIDALYLERVRRARQMSPAEKFWEGPRLFDEECRIECEGIRQQFPDADEVQVLDILRQRLAERRQLEDGNLYQPVQLPSSAPLGEQP